MAKNNFTGMLGSTQKLKATSDSGDTKDTKATRDTENSGGAGDIYRLNLKLSGDLKQYLADEACRQSLSKRRRISITQLVNDILEEYKEQHPSPEGGI